MDPAGFLRATPPFDALPEPLFADAFEPSTRPRSTGSNGSRSFAASSAKEAVAECHEPGAVTEALNRRAGELDTRSDELAAAAAAAAAAARRVLERSQQ